MTTTTNGARRLTWRAKAGTRNRAALLVPRAHPNRKKAAAGLSLSRSSLDKWATGCESNPYYRAACAMRVAENPMAVVAFFEEEAMRELEDRPREWLLNRWCELVEREHREQGEQDYYMYGPDPDKAVAACRQHAQTVMEIAAVRKILSRVHGVHDPHKAVRCKEGK